MEAWTPIGMNIMLFNLYYLVTMCREIVSFYIIMYKLFEKNHDKWSTFVAHNEIWCWSKALMGF